MSNKLCLHCGGEAKGSDYGGGDLNPLGVDIYCTECPARMHWTDNNLEQWHWDIWNRRFICLDKNGEKVYAGDRVKTPDYKGKVDCLGGICIESEDGHLHHVWPSEIELVKEVK